jgi:hypothetical protein
MVSGRRWRRTRRSSERARRAGAIHSAQQRHTHAPRRPCSHRSVRGGGAPGACASTQGAATPPQRRARAGLCRTRRCNCPCCDGRRRAREAQPCVAVRSRAQRRSRATDARASRTRRDGAPRPAPRAPVVLGTRCQRHALLEALLDAAGVHGRGARRAACQPAEQQGREQRSPRGRARALRPCGAAARRAALRPHGVRADRGCEHSSRHGARSVTRQLSADHGTPHRAGCAFYTRLLPAVAHMLPYLHLSSPATVLAARSRRHTPSPSPLRPRVLA